MENENKPEITKCREFACHWFGTIAECRDKCEHIPTDCIERVRDRS
jgi:hypothetical protein